MCLEKSIGVQNVFRKINQHLKCKILIVTLVTTGFTMINILNPKHLFISVLFTHKND
jgi:hypothetical protein